MPSEEFLIENGMEIKINPHLFRAKLTYEEEQVIDDFCINCRKETQNIMFMPC